VSQGEHQLSKGQLVLTGTKSERSRRTFILPASLMEELTAHMAEFISAEPNARVFTGEKGGSLRRHVLQKHWDRARRQVDLPEGFVFHDLRHTAQTLAGRAGATLADLKRRGGHSSTEAVMRYQHATEENDRHIADAMDAMVSDAREKRAMNAPSTPALDTDGEGSDADAKR
jgi:integrase